MRAFQSCQGGVSFCELLGKYLLPYLVYPGLFYKQIKWFSHLRIVLHTSCDVAVLFQNLWQCKEEVYSTLSFLPLVLPFLPLWKYRSVKKQRILFNIYFFLAKTQGKQGYIFFFFLLICWYRKLMEPILKKRVRQQFCTVSTFPPWSTKRVGTLNP